ncbi:UPF0193 protein EVG1 homolog [Sitophilus oryzae]|uniref:UPF0193 protein EVG1 homolog n=1 Tax=Sitophilus oryzae TaxID=7048 RepID=A0A6J2YAY0_SITOR|nr:UPF0193 protein EVG1 homolog [Sitophilus oryzae]
MQWQSKNVPQGGILQPPRASYSPETHNFLKVLMEESRMSAMQRRKVDYILRNGEPLPPLQRKMSRPKNNIPEVTIRPGSSKRRSREAILLSGAYEKDIFRPIKPGMDREREIEKLANKMAYREDVHVTKSKVLKKLEKEKVELAANRFDQLVQEIKEREEWLKEMDELGEGNKYKLIIEQQIQNKVREMDRLKLSALD